MKNLKGKFKNIGSSVVSDLTTVAAMGGVKKALGFIPSSIGGKDISPAIKGGIGYIACKLLLGGSKKGFMQNIALGASLGCAQVAASPILEKIGIGSTDDAFVSGGSEFIRIKRDDSAISGKQSENAFVGNVL